MPIPKRPGPPAAPKPVTDLEVTPNGKVSTPPVRTGSAPHPHLVNRGPAGLLHRKKATGGVLTEEVVEDKPQMTRARAKYEIAPPLLHMAVDVDSLVLDPDNARLHNDRNKDAIKESLLSFGQVKPVVVRKQTGVIVAGNGTTECARELGWKKVAAVFVDMSDAEAAAYGLADNRTAELAKWDFEVVARLDKMIQEAGLSMAGWTNDELEVLRAADWVPPVQSDEAFGGDDPNAPAVLRILAEEHRIFKVAVDVARTRTGNKKMTEGEALVLIANAYMGVETTDGETHADSGEREEEGAAADPEDDRTAR